MSPGQLKVDDEDSDLGDNRSPVNMGGRKSGNLRLFEFLDQALLFPLFLFEKGW